MLHRVHENIVKYKTAILYSSTSVIKAMTTMLVGFVIAKYVSPEDLGLWSTLLLFLTYSVFVQGGIINGLNIELPFAYGKGESAKAEKMAGVAQSFTLITSLIVCIMGVGLFFFYPTENGKVKYGILGITIVVIFTFYQAYLLSTFRSNNSFLKLSKIQFFEAILNIFTIILVVYFAYYGMILKSVVMIIFFVAILHIYRPIKTKLFWNKEIFYHLSKVGLPIFVLILIDSSVSTIDKVWLLKYTNLEQVGLYTFGLYALNLFVLFSSSIASYVYPKMTYNYAQNNDRLILWGYMKKVTWLLLLIQTPLVLIGFFAIPPLVEHFFPSYILSTTPMQILLIAGLMKGSVIGVNILWSMKMWKYMYVYVLSYAFLLAVFTFIGLKIFEEKLVGVSLGVLLANTLNLIIAINLSYRATHISRNETVNNIFNR